MKIIIALLFVGFIQVHASTSAQNITINQRNMSVEKILTEVKKQTGYLFVYNQEWIKLSRKVDINVKNVALKEVLDLSFADQPLTYSIVDKTIIVQLKKQPAAVYLAPVAIDVTGHIKDEKGEPLPGVTVIVKGTTIGTQTDFNGNFSLKVPEKSILVFSMISYKTKEIVVDGKRAFNISMEESRSQLSEVVVSGYNSQNKAEFTGSAAHIGAEDIANKPVQSFEQALAGQAAGVNVIQPSGVLNNSPVFRIRGFNSISLSSYPLIIVDGVALFTGSVGSFAANNPLADINPNDIESLDILKDASATAIYGSRAANGVVVITTKKGKKGNVKANYDGWVGSTSTYNLPKVLNAEQYVTIKNEALVNAGSAPGYKLQYRADGSLIDTRWYDYAYHTGISHNHNLNFSGGTDKTSYFVSLGYSNQQGILVQNTFERKVGRVNIDQKLTVKLNVGSNFSFSNSINRSPSTGSLPGQAAQLTGLAREAMVLPPNLSPYNADGSYNIVGNSIGYGAGDPSTISGYYNPVVLLDLDKYSSESNALIGNVYGELEIIKNLKLKTSYSLDQSTVENVQFTNPLQGFPGYDAGGSAINASTKNYRWDWTNTINYTPTIGKKQHLNVLAGYEEISTTSVGWGATRTKLTDNYYNTFQGGYANITVSGNSQGDNRFRSYFSSMNYDYDKKYLLSGSFRRDGYSGLSAGNKYGNFAGGSVGWNVAEEDFFKELSIANTINSLKLRASYGKVGNLNIGNYPALSLYASSLYGTIATLGFNQAGNPDLRWETSKKTDFGLNFGFFDNRIVLDVDYYNNNIDGMILNAAQAPSKGIPSNSITTNIGSMYNRGFEFSVDAHIITQGPVKWTANFNFSTLQNKVTALANGVDIYGTGLDPSNVTRVGYSLGSIFVVQTTGVNPANGQRMYINRNNQIVQYNYAATQKWTYLDGSAAPAMDAKADGRVIGPSIPTYYGGFNNNLQYKAFDMAINIGYSGGNKLYNGTKTTLMDGRFYNNSVNILNRWTHPGQITDVPRVVFNDNFSSGSSLANTASVEDGSFIKLRSVALGYRLPKSVVTKAGIASMRVYIQGSNLLTITKYTGTDPEVSSNGDSNSAPGVEKNSAPQARTVTFGVNIGF
ncbi:TonB-dependent receptor [Mucilaginibacter sp. UR6-11]|uniref:TonB-dependent receptor n=1 Tax=Mucilaginibacter sp. UR6-11 TaxID=1435644 RepID=UPI001E3F2D4C|nr:TonB-dependent receptor [Mucilaginibacter sp. UR6-11]MCC8423708.1 TonB-dependent receptor [Mucilaginibacter sp. UR6-11]